MNVTTKAPSASKADAVRNKIKNGAVDKKEIMVPALVSIPPIQSTEGAAEEVTQEAVANEQVAPKASAGPAEKRRGRPRKSDQDKPTGVPKDRVTFTLAVSREDYKKLSILAGKKQVETGEPYSAQKLVKETLGHALSIKFL